MAFNYLRGIWDAIIQPLSSSPGRPPERHLFQPGGGGVLQLSNQNWIPMVDANYNFVGYVPASIVSQQNGGQAPTAPMHTASAPRDGHVVLPTAGHPPQIPSTHALEATPATAPAASAIAPASPSASATNATVPTVAPAPTPGVTPASGAAPAHVVAPAATAAAAPVAASAPTTAIVPAPSLAIAPTPTPTGTGTLAAAAATAAPAAAATAAPAAGGMADPAAAATAAPAAPAPAATAPTPAASAPAPRASAHGAVSAPAAAPPLNSVITYDDEAAPWDPWPDGLLKRTYSYEHARTSQDFMVHWSMTCQGGILQGSALAVEWQDGLRRIRTCNGILECQKCPLIVRPQTRESNIAKQLALPCPLHNCGGQLVHRSCNVVMRTWQYRDGVHVEHSSYHAHRRPTHVLHLTNDEKKRLRTIFKEHPTAGPLELIIGHAGRPSVADTISPLLVNADRVRAERNQFRRQTHQDFPTAFASFSEDHDGFIVAHKFAEDGITLVCMQSDFMRTQLYQAQVADRNVCGIVTDAAHKFWREKHCVLIISSVYSHTLSRWVPGLMSYSDGSTAAHYCYHFLILFHSIALQCQKQGAPVTDEILANVIDFSEAERSGFVTAYVSFREWEQQAAAASGVVLPTRDELEAKALRLLKGCRQHFSAQVTRVSGIGGVVHPLRREEFCNRARDLVNLKSKADFQSAANSLLRDFPKVQPWLEWWLRDNTARMVFESQREMDIELWNSLPETTNAEESLHNKIYKGIGKDFTLMEGLNALWLFADGLQKQSSAAESGMKIHYGDPEPWKTIKAKIGRTKLTRAPAYRAGRRHRAPNDGRPMDTAKQLLGTRKPARKKASPPQALAGIAWNKNSCWLDTALELLFYAIARVPDDFDLSFRSMTGRQVASADSQPVYELLDSIVRRFDISPGDVSSALDTHTRQIRTNQLTALRNELRQALYEKNIEPNTYTGAHIWSWLVRLLSRSSSMPDRPHDVTSIQQLYFATSTIIWRDCQGDTAANVPRHFRLTPNASLRYMLELPGAASASNYRGEIKRWFHDFMSVKKPEQDMCCWRQVGGKLLCNGQANIKDIVTSIPVVLILVFEGFDERKARFETQWDAPSELFPLTQALARSHEIVYDIVGRAYYDPLNSHYWARLTPNGKAVYHYDGMSDGGSSVLKENMTVTNDIAGKITVPAGYQGPRPMSLVYHLRGGARAQRSFFKRRMLSIEHKFPEVWLGDACGPAPHTSIHSDSAATATHLPRENAAGDAEGPHHAGKEDRKQQAHTTPSKSGTTLPVKRSAASKQPTTAPLIKKPKIHHAATPPSADASVPSQSIAKRTRSASAASVKQKGQPQKRVRVAIDAQSKPGSAKVTAAATTAPARRTTGSDDGSSDSVFDFHCRCGVSGQGDDVSSDLNLAIIRCDVCHNWSHIACQYDGRAGDSIAMKDEPFLCDDCADGPGSKIGMLNRSSLSAPEHDYYAALEKRAQLPLERRLRVGQGCLVRDGRFWYPARILDADLAEGTWTITFWRLRHFCASVAAGDRKLTRAAITLEDIRDELWHDHEARRKIRLGKWVRSMDIPDADDALLRYNDFPYSSEVHNALSPHRQTLILIFMHGHAGDNLQLAKIPCIQWLRSSSTTSAPGSQTLGESKRNGLVPFEGPLHPEDRARIANWISKNIPEAQANSLEWFGKALMAHAQTIFLSQQRKQSIIRSLGDSYPSGPGCAAKRVRALQDAAWEIFRTERWSEAHAVPGVDIDLECLALLERKILESSEEAGRAGNWQWGLDVGEHQHGWHPYEDLSARWGSPRAPDTDRDNEECTRTHPDGDQWAEASEDCENDASPSTPAIRPRPKPTHRKRSRV
ncbi:hypothetical protein EV715DRAFT_293655 [Schizophyllum commune]